MFLVLGADLPNNVTGTFVHSHSFLYDRKPRRKTNTQDIARGVHSRLLAAVPGLDLVRGVMLDRFLHHDLLDQLEGQEEVRSRGMAEAA